MSRLRGPKAVKPRETTQFLLNHRLFGNHEFGGKTIDLSAVKKPIDWSDLFNRDAPIAVEIGFNRGVFLEGLAKIEPETNLLGIEIQRRFCWRLANLLEENADSPMNLRLLWADAKLVTDALLEPGTVSDIYINFPDPWWKKRHHKRRLVDTDYAAELVKLLRPEGRIWVKSDVKAIAEEIEAALVTQSSLKGPEPYSAKDKPPTHRESKCIEQGLPIYRFRYSKNQ